MKNRTAMIALTLVCVALIIGLTWSQKRAIDQRQETDTYSNKWATASETLTQQTKVNSELESDLTQRRSENSTLSNNLVQAAANLDKAESALHTTRQEM